jgi:hypothetical protein
MFCYTIKAHVFDVKYIVAIMEKQQPLISTSTKPGIRGPLIKYVAANLASNRQNKESCIDRESDT